MLDTPRDRQSYPLDKDFEIGDLTFDIVGRFTDTSTGTYTVGQQIIGFSLDKSTSLQENAYINVSSNPTEIDATRGVYRYTIASVANRGLDSNQTSSSSLNSQVSNQKRHQAGREVGIVNSAIYQAELKTEFSSNTTSEEVTSGSGEAFAIRSQLSLHTDGKYYKYHATNYPNWIGTALTATTGASEDFTIAYPGYEVPGFTGLTVGVRQYAENTGATTETPSTTTYYIGKSKNATTIPLQSSAPSVDEASQAEAEAGTAQGVYMSPLRTSQAIDAQAFNIGDIKMVETTGTGVLGVAGNIAIGFAVCDGTTPASQGVTSPVRTEVTPNLVSSFVRGNATVSGATGGNATHSHTVAAHAHTITGLVGSWQASPASSVDGYSPGGSVTSSGTSDNASPSTDAINNEPPYYEVVFMMKVR